MLPGGQLGEMLFTVGVLVTILFQPPPPSKGGSPA
jgi:hypothetical protein